MGMTKIILLSTITSSLMVLFVLMLLGAMADVHVGL
jgi:hypothetical protein